MPGFDGSGPAFQGPRTGWGRGRCAPAGDQEGKTEDSTGAGTAGPVAGPGIIYGVGRGGIPRGCGRGFCGGRGQVRGRWKCLEDTE